MTYEYYLLIIGRQPRVEARIFLLEVPRISLNPAALLVAFYLYLPGPTLLTLRDQMIP